MFEREKIIKNYIEGYNYLDVDQMVLDFDDKTVFENIQAGVTNMSLIGRDAFIHQAEQAKAYFSNRTQVIRSFSHFGNTTEIEIDYHAIAANDLPNGLKKGQELKLTGKSIFAFECGKIRKLTDISW